MGNYSPIFRKWRGIPARLPTPERRAAVEALVARACTVGGIISAHALCFRHSGQPQGLPLRRRGDTNLVGAGLVPARFACCNHIAKTLIRTRQDLLDEPLHLLGLAHLGEALRVQRLPTNRVARSPPHHSAIPRISSPSSQLTRLISEPLPLRVGSPRVGVLLSLIPSGASPTRRAQTTPAAQAAVQAAPAR